MRRELLRMIAQLRGRGRLPMIGAQHGSQIVEMLARAALRVHAGAEARRAHTQVQRIRAYQSGGAQRREQRIRRTLERVVGPGCIDDHVHGQNVRRRAWPPRGCHDTRNRRPAGITA